MTTQPPLRYAVADVFTDTPLEGNQLGVFTDARALSAEQMQRLAREMNFAESTFILPAERGGDARIRIFTPAHELPFAGHPVLGSAVVVGKARDLHVDIDAVHQRSGNFLHIALDHRLSAVAFACRISEIPARTRVHRSSQHEARRKRHGNRGARYRHGAVLQRLTS